MVIKSNAAIGGASVAAAVADPTFAERVEELRRAFGSDNAIARAIGVHSNTITRWRHERRTRVSIEELRRLAEVSGKSANWLIGLDESDRAHTVKPRQRFVSGVDMERFEHILATISELGLWARATVREKLNDAVQIYDLLKGRDPTPEQVRRIFMQMRRRR